MFNFLPNANLRFGDFALLAMLLFLMYAMTALEARSARDKGSTGESNRKRAAAASFFGMLVTLCVGAAADSLSGGDVLLVAAPVSFICVWAYFHYRSNRDLLDVKELASHMDKAFEESAVTVLRGSNVPLTADEIRARAVSTDYYLKSVFLAGQLTKTVGPIALGDLIGQLLPSPDKTDTLLEDLQKSGKITRGNGGYTLPPAPAPAPAPAKPGFRM